MILQLHIIKDNQQRSLAPWIKWQLDGTVDEYDMLEMPGLGVSDGGAETARTWQIGP